MRLGPGLLYEGRTLQGARPKLADFCSATMAEFYSAVDIERRGVMNKSELKMFGMLRNDLPHDWLLMCQVSYGAMLKNRDYKRYMSINSKRADFVVFSPEMSVVAVIEYQGAGHFGRSAQSRQRAEVSDRVKRQALSEANIPLVEIPEKFDREYVQKLVAAIVGPDSETSGAKEMNPNTTQEAENV